MRPISAWLFPLLLLSGCGGPQAPEAKSPATQPEAKTIVKPPEVTAPTADIGGEIIATVALGSLDSLLKQAAAYLQPHLPPPMANMAQADALRGQLFKAMRAEELEKSFDASRPLVMAIGDPKFYRGSELGPLLVGLPLKDCQGLLDLLSKRSERHETTAWREHIFAMGSDAVRVRCDKEWAFVASHEKLTAGAAGVLGPLAGRAKPGAAHVEIRVAEIVDRHGKELDKMIAKAERKATRKEGLEVGAIHTILRWVGYLRGIQTLSLTAQLDAADIRLRASALAKGGPGEFQTYLSQLDAGEAWGASFVPKESALLLLSRASEAGRSAELDRNLKVLKSVLKGAVDEAMISRWGEGLRNVSKALSGEMALGVWATSEGGVGAGGAVRVKDPKTARGELAKLMKVVGKDVGGLLKGLQLPAELKGLGIALQARANGLRVGGQSADLYELVIRWPRPPTAEGRRKLDELKKGLAKVLGPKLVVAFTASGETGLFALGKDHRKRMGELLSAAKGGAGSGMDKAVRAHVGGRKLVVFAYSPLASVVEGALRVAGQLTTVPADVRDAIAKALPAGKDIPLAASMHREGQQASWDLSISPDVIGVIAKGMMLAFMPRATP